MNKFVSSFIVFNMLFSLTCPVAFASDGENKFFGFFKKNSNSTESLSEDEKVEKKNFELFKAKDVDVVEVDRSELDVPEENSDNKKLTRKEKKINELKDKYKEYSIPTDTYMPVGSTSDKVIKIVGSVERTLELNLADCLELMLINNPAIKSAYANSEAFKYKKFQTLSNYSPVVNLTGGVSRVNPDSRMFSANGLKFDPFTRYTTGSIGISQLVYDFGITQNQYTIDKLVWENTKANIDSVVNIVIAQVKDAYYNLVFAIETKRVALETFEQFEIMYKQASAFYEVGTKPKVDVTIAQVNMEDARASYISASNNVDIAISALNNLMGLPFIPPYVVDMSSPFLEVEIDMRSAVEIANSSRPDLKMAKIDIETADQYVKLAKKAFMPKIELSGNYAIGGVGETSPTDVSWWDFGANLNFPSINPFLIRNQIKEARALYDKQKYDSKASINDIYYDIQSTYVRLMDAKQRVPVSKLAVKMAKENYELSSGRYAVGVADAIEYKEAQVQYYDARRAYFNTLYEYNSAKASLERAIGQTLPSVENKEVEI